MRYKLNEDIDVVCELLSVSASELSKQIGFDLRALYRYKDGDTNISDTILELIYNYIFTKKINLSCIKEMIYKEELKKEEVLLFHGSKNEITGPIDLTYCRERNDFGKGFYCGESVEQSIMFVSNYKTPNLYMIKFCPNGLRQYSFSVNQEWMLAIAYFRGRLEKYKDTKVIQEIISKIKEMDYIVAPIADNRMFQTIDSFIDGEITDIQCQHALAATNLGYQYVMISNEAISRLEILEKCYISEEEKKQYALKKAEENKIGEDKVRLSKIKYRGIGKYIDEVLS